MNITQKTTVTSYVVELTLNEFTTIKRALGEASSPTVSPENDSRLGFELFRQFKAALG